MEQPQLEARGDEWRDPLREKKSQKFGAATIGEARGDRVEASTHVETSSRGKFRAKWAEGSHAAIPPGVRWGDVK